MITGIWYCQEVQKLVVSLIKTKAYAPPPPTSQAHFLTSSLVKSVSLSRSIRNVLLPGAPDQSPVTHPSTASSIRCPNPISSSNN